MTRLFATALALALGSGCSPAPRASFDEALARHRGTLISQVNLPGPGIPFYTVATLNPTWEESRAIVKMPSFGLIDQDGEARDQSIFRDRVSVVAFFFTSCGGFCPNLIENLKKVAAELGDVPNLQIVAFTVDPEHDDPAALAAYAKDKELAPRKRWTLLTGSRDTIWAIAKDALASQAFRRADESGQRNFVHSEHFYVFDERSRLRAILNGTRSEAAKEAKKIVLDLRGLGPDRYAGTD